MYCNKGNDRRYGIVKIIGNSRGCKEIMENLVVFHKKHPAFALTKKLAASAPEDTEFLL